MCIQKLPEYSRPSVGDWRLTSVGYVNLAMGNPRMVLLIGRSKQRKMIEGIYLQAEIFRKKTPPGHGGGLSIVSGIGGLNSNIKYLD